MDNQASQPTRDEAVQPKHNIRTQFDADIAIGIYQYQKEMGLPFPQDVVRLLVASGLQRLGFPRKVEKK